MGKTKQTWGLKISRGERVGFRVFAVLIFAVQVYFQWGRDVLPWSSSPSFREQQRVTWVHQLADSVVLRENEGSFRRSRDASTQSDQQLTRTTQEPASNVRKAQEYNGYDAGKLQNVDAANVVHAPVLSPSLEIPVELNSADSLTLLKVRGIGAYTAHTLLQWREKFGGFYTVDQLYDLPGIYAENVAVIAPQVTVDASLVKKISINTASYEELVRHPYISGDLAGQIVRFRGYFRPFESVRELGQLDLRNPLDFDKLVPYLITHSTEDSTQSIR